ncbi:hypothetical protein AAG906_002805 [Vitis piasezkii]
MFGSILEEVDTLMLIGVRSLKTCIAQSYACVKVMPTLHGSASSLRRRAEGCVPLEGTIVSARDPLKLFCIIDQIGMDQQVVTVDQFTAVMASIQEALANLRQKIDNETPYDSLPSPPPPLGLTVPQAPSYLLHGHSKVAPPIVVQTIILEDTHACMDRIERIKQLRVSIVQQLDFVLKVIRGLIKDPRGKFRPN